MSHFPTAYTEILQLIDQVDPVAYGKTRNFIDGAVTRLSPYISRGVISTKQVYERTLERGYSPWDIEKFIQELAWRDYWQQVWQAKGEEINEDLRRPQELVENQAVPKAVLEGETGIEGVDVGLRELFETGYLHNHLRMYVAFLACNAGRSHWKVPARWMYYHLLDGDWASNALSWQWVAGSNAGKKYIANQANINKYCHTQQFGTFLDHPYEEIAKMEIPEVLRETTLPELSVSLPTSDALDVDPSLPTMVYTHYNLDPRWHSTLPANRILLLEPSHFQAYPMARRTIDFCISLAQNIPGIQVHVGEFSDLSTQYDLQDIRFKEHPFSRHFVGEEEARDWMFSVEGYFTSFFAFWKRCRKQISK